MTDEVLKDIILNVLKCTLYVVHETPPPDYLNMMQASILGQNFTFRPMRSSLSVMEKCFFFCVSGTAMIVIILVPSPSPPSLPSPTVLDATDS